jgi:PDZ domain
MTMFQRGAVLLALTLTAASAAPALGQQARGRDAQACFGQRLDQAADLAKLMAACQRVIGDSRAKTEERAEAHLRRGFAYAQRAGQTGRKGDVDRALADLAEAGRLVPGNQDVQRYVAEARASLQRPAAQPKGGMADEKVADAREVDLLKEELRKTQERLAAVEAAKPAAPAGEPSGLQPLHRGAIGVTGRGLPDGAGLMIAEVKPGGPADRAGLRPGDIVVAIDGRRVHGAREMREFIGRRHPGTVVGVSFMRDRRRQAVAVEIAPDRLGRRLDEQR